MAVGGRSKLSKSPSRTHNQLSGVERHLVLFDNRQHEAYGA